MKRQVVVSGLGVISSLGVGWQRFWESLLIGKSGISEIATFDVSKYKCRCAGEVKNFNPEHFIDTRLLKQIGRASQMTIAASQLALGDGRVNLKALKNKKIGVAIGTTMGEIQVMENINDKNLLEGRLSVDRVSAMSYPASSLSNIVAINFSLKAQNLVFSNACAAGNYAIGYAYDLIKTGKADLMLAGGADAFSRIAFTGFSRLFAVAPEKCQPFDKNRKGMIPGEGAGIVVMETLESARKRDAPVYAEIAGYGMSCDAHHMTAPDPEGVAKAIRRALDSAGIDPEDVDYISAHGTGTKENDKAECAAVHAVFGKRAAQIPMSSIKSMLGHTMGAASVLEAIACCLAIKNQRIPPTINLEEQDAECCIDCVPNQSRKCKINVVLNDSQAFGGNNSCVALNGIRY